MLSSGFVSFGSIRRFTAGVAALTAFGAPVLASGQTVTFETLNYSGACQPGGGSMFSTLDGKSWDGFRALDLTNYRGACGQATENGYELLQSGAVGKVIGLGAGVAHVNSVNPFVLNSMVAGAGWQNPTSLFMQFYLNSVLMDTKTIILTTNQTGLSLYTGFYAGATDFIRFTPTYPTDNSGDVFGSFDKSCPAGSTNCVKQRYESWFVDNLNFSPAAVVVVTPEPASVAMIGVGLVVLGVMRRRRV